MNIAAEVLEQDAMSFSSLFHKASNFLGFGAQDRSQLPPPDGEIIYCKNNICVHPPTNLNRATEHYPGYLNIRSQDDEVLGSTLILTWIPNSTLKKNPHSIENSPAQTRMTRKSPRQEHSKVTLGTGCFADGSFMQSPVTGSCTAYGDVRRMSADDVGTLQNNERGVSQKPVHIHACVNQIHKQTNMVKNCNVARTEETNAMLDAVGGGDAVDDIPCETSRSSESDSPSTEQQLKVLVQRNQIQNSAAQQLQGQESSRKCSGSSGRSVASVEMDGDNLVVVTEEIDDDTFENPSQTVTDQKIDSKFERRDESGNSPVDANGGNSSGRDSSSSESSSTGSEGSHYEKMINFIKSDRIANECCSKPDINCLKESLGLKLKLGKGSDNIKEVSDHNFNISGDSCNYSSSSSATSGPNGGPLSLVPLTDGHASPSAECNASGVSLAGNRVGSRGFANRNLSFPDETLTTSSTPSPGLFSPNNIIDQVCGVFSVDLGQMRSMRIFYNDEPCTCGQLVIASRESQYKVLHFHHGGLDRLVETFSGWKFLAQPKRRPGDVEAHCHHFSIIRPYLTNDQCHPEEGAHEVVNETSWRRHMNELGQIEDDFQLRKAIFFAGLEASLRPEIWPFLLHYYPYSSSFEEREHLRNDRYIDYHNIRKARLVCF